MTSKRKTKPPFEQVGDNAHVQDLADPKTLLKWHVDNVAFHGYPSSHTIVRDRGGEIVRYDGTPVVMGVPSPCCGIVETKDGRPALGYNPGEIYVGNRKESRADDFWCGVCDSPFRGTISDLLRHWYKGDPTGLESYVKTKCKGSVPKRERSTAARYGGEVGWGADTEKAIEKVLPHGHTGEVELCLISAYTPERAAAIVNKHADELPWTTAPVTQAGEVRVLHWHGTDSTVTERGRYDDVKRREFQQRERELEDKIARLRAEHRAELRGL